MLFLNLHNHSPYDLLLYPFFFYRLRLPPRSPLFPYTTLFRSASARTSSSRDPLVGHRRGCQGGGQCELRTFERPAQRDRKSTRLNSSHEWTSYAVFCLKKKNK